MNERRSGISNSSVILDGRIWIMGGWNEEEDELKSVEMYDPSKNREMNQRRALAAAAAVNGKIFCFGGSDGYDILKSAESYDPSSDVWTLISNMPAPNATCGVVVMDGHLIAIGGKTGVDDNFLNSVWVLDTTDTSGEWISKETCLSRPLCQFSIARIDDKIFVCGGIYIDQKDSILKSTCDVEIFDGKAWRHGSKIPTSLFNSAAVVIPMEFARYLN